MNESQTTEEKTATRKRSSAKVQLAIDRINHKLMLISKEKEDLDLEIRFLNQQHDELLAINDGRIHSVK